MSNGARPPYWELHIKPMFRLLDEQHMIGSAVPPDRRVDLYDYADVKAKADEVLGALQDNFMPPGDEGGPWPAEWVAVFKRWVEKQCPRLDRGDATWVATRSGPTVTLTATVKLPKGGDQTWIEPLPYVGTAPRFVLYREAVGKGAPVTVTRNARFEAAPGLDFVIVEDAGGEKKVPIPR